MKTDSPFQTESTRAVAEILRHRYGGSAVRQAAQREQDAHSSGKDGEAGQWRQVRMVLEGLKGAPES